jgi:hypothetical protein
LKRHENGARTTAKSIDALDGWSVPWIDTLIPTAEPTLARQSHILPGDGAGIVSNQ